MTDLKNEKKYRLRRIFCCGSQPLSILIPGESFPSLLAGRETKIAHPSDESFLTWFRCEGVKEKIGEVDVIDELGVEVGDFCVSLTYSKLLESHLSCPGSEAMTEVVGYLVH